MTLDELFARIADVKVRCHPVDASVLTSAEIEDVDHLIGMECADRFDEAKAVEDAEHLRAIRGAVVDVRDDPDAHLGAEEEDAPGYGHGV